METLFVLDACALIALLKNETGASVVTDAYRKAANGEAKIIMNRINLLEVYYGYYRDDGKEYAEKILNGIMRSIISITDFNETLFHEAGRLKASYNISLADAIVLAQTLLTDGALLTADHHEMSSIEGREPIKINWIR